LKDVGEVGRDCSPQKEEEEEEDEKEEEEDEKEEEVYDMWNRYYASL
jgi:hypothetical protein